MWQDTSQCICDDHAGLHPPANDAAGALQNSCSSVQHALDAGPESEDSRTWSKLQQLERQNAMHVRRIAEL